MNRCVRWCLSVGLLLATTVALAQSPYSTLPRPREIPTNFAIEQLPPPDPPAPLAPPIAAPDVLPVAPPSLASCDETPFHRCVRPEFDVVLLFPHVYQHLNAPLNVGGLYNTIAELPTAPLGVTAAPIPKLRIDLPWHGDLVLGYRPLIAEGRTTLPVGVPDPFGTSRLRSRLDMHLFDFNYASAGYNRLWNMLWFVNNDPIRPLWGLRWDLGGRVATMYFDSQSTGTIIHRRVTSHFVGGGPRVGLTLSRLLGDSNMSIYARSDFGSLWGRVNQTFSELATDFAGNPLGFGFNTRRQSRSVPTLAAELGIATEPNPSFRGQFQVAYQYEQWFSIATAGGSTGDLLNHGLVLRWMWTY